MIIITDKEIRDIYGNHYSYIYKLINCIDYKIYIGKAVNPVRRWHRHVEDSYDEFSSSYNNPIHRAIRKYGEDNFELEIIDFADSRAEINEKEKYYIKLYKCQEYDIGYNIADGGDGGDVLSNKSQEDYEIACNHYREAALLRESNPELREKKSKKMKELRATTNPIWNKGKSTKPESIEKRKETMKKKKESGWVPNRRPLSKPLNGRYIRCIETGELFVSATEAVRKMSLVMDKCDAKTIVGYCKGRRSNPKRRGTEYRDAPFGYTWEYVESDDESINSR